MTALAPSASAQALPWDNTRNGNPYVLHGYGDQCTAFAFGRYKTINSESLKFANPQGKSVYPDAGLMYDYLVETSTSYRDSRPVRGALVCWKKAGAPGHAGHIERVNSNGSVEISEQNWPLRSGPRRTNLTASALQSRPTSTGAYALAGFVNPNRPTAIGTLFTTRINKTFQVDVALTDEDRRDVSILFGILEDGRVLSGTAGSGKVAPNNPVSIRWGNTSMLRRGRTYSVYLVTHDFRGLRSSKTVAFTW
jgi:surface antigen